ncbi:Protein of unknown function (DUF3098) [Breznakibacter xylanolyticus]|uniref:DUF3098 family protein n=1 Tax=Breznakibacter xylanolyticus TaxID=990 RepID=A0A2W7QCG5_9BACT|nr:DUF3098 domain-containing protein [Breznakibacter xylanolyticus]PZX19499.1 Protein of unknown function (DUF3098) [Breznakibacter xylanolyticus]
MVKKDDNKPNFALSKENYVLMAIGFGIIILGFILMVGGRSSDLNVFNADEVYGWRRITLAPVIVLIGFLFEIYAIMKKPKGE